MSSRLGLLAAGVLLLLVVGPPAIEQAQKFEAELPATIQGFYELPLVGDWMEENEYESVEQMIGSMSLQRCPDPVGFERANYMKVIQSWRYGSLS